MLGSTPLPTPDAAEPSSFDAAIFAGGGCRCFWQLGFWSTAAPRLGLAPRVVGGVSAGAAFACVAVAGVTGRAVEDFKQRSRDNERNMYPRNLLRGRPVFPHEQIYRDTILHTIDHEVLENLRAGPEIRILLARPPGWLGDRSGFLLAALAHWLDKRGPERVHTRWGRRAGFRSEVVSVRSCETPDDLADLILHSSCTPPLTPLYRRDRRVVIDGGLIDNAPVETAPEARDALVLLTRFFSPEAIPRAPGRTYVAPSRPVPIVNWDYTSPELVQQTYDLGRSDGERFADRQA